MWLWLTDFEIWEGCCWGMELQTCKLGANRRDMCVFWGRHLDCSKQACGGLSLSVRFTMLLPNACSSSDLIFIIVYPHIFNGLVYRKWLLSVHNVNVSLDQSPSRALNKADVLGKNSIWSCDLNCSITHTNKGWKRMQTTCLKNFVCSYRCIKIFIVIDFNFIEVNCKYLFQSCSLVSPTLAPKNW